MDLKTEIREYFYTIHGSHIETDIANIIAIAEKHIALQLQQTGVSGSVSKYEKCNYAMPDCKHCALANCIYLNDGGM